MKKFLLSSQDKLHKKVVVSSLLSALTFIFYFFSNIPVLNLVGVVLCPLPLTLVSYVYGVGLGFISLLVSIFLTFIFLGPLQAYFFFSIFGVLGFLTGIFSRQFLDPIRITIWTMLVILILNISFYYGIEKVLGLEDILKEIKSFFMYIVNFLGKYFLPLTYKKYIIYYINILLSFPLFIFFLLSFSMFFINFYAAGIVFNRFSLPYPALPPIFYWYLPREVVGLFIVTLIFVFFVRIKILFYFLINLLTILYVSFFVIGYGIIIYFLGYYRVSPWWRLITLFLILICNFLVVLLAMLDTFFDFRRIHKKKAKW